MQIFEINDNQLAKLEKKSQNLDDLQIHEGAGHF